MSLSSSLRDDQTALSSDQLLTEIAVLNGEILSAVPSTSRGQGEFSLAISLGLCELL